MPTLHRFFHTRLLGRAVSQDEAIRHADQVNDQIARAYDNAPAHERPLLLPALKASWDYAKELRAEAIGFR